MSTELLSFGIVSLFVTVVAAVIASLVLLNQLLLWVGRIALSLDAEGAPKVLQKNLLLDKVRWASTPLATTWCVKKDGLYFDKEDNKFWRKRYNCVFLSRKVAEGVATEHSAAVVAEGSPYPIAVTKVAIISMSVDIVILWLQQHFLSAVWSLSAIGVILTLRFITGKIWGHNSRITVLEEK
jgi:hypothetical protein